MLLSRSWNYSLANAGSAVDQLLNGVTHRRVRSSHQTLRSRWVYVSGRTGADRVPVQNRIGDYVHCTGRVVNIILKRILAHFPDPRVTNTVKDIISRLTLESQGIPIQDSRVLLLS